MKGGRCYIVSLVLLGCAAAFGTVAAPPDDPRDLDRMQDALRALRDGRHAQAEREAMDLAVRADRPLARSWLIVAAARQRQKQYASAVRAYRMFLAACSSPEMRDRVAEQIRTCQAALDADQGPHAPTKRLSPADLDELAKVDEAVCVESSEHFVIRSRYAQLAKLLAAEAEAALQRICGIILAGQEFPHSVDVYVWADPAEFAAHARSAPEWSGGSFRVDCRDGLVTRRIDLTQRTADGRFDTIMVDRVLPHEMCHLVVKELFGDAACPLFLDEGLAMLAESEIDNRRIELAGAALAGRAKIPLDDLLVGRRDDAGDPAVFYAEAFSLTEFLHGRLTRPQFAAFLKHVRYGCGVAEALQRALYVAPDDRFLPALTAAWEDCAIAQGQYLRALRQRELTATTAD